MSGFLESSPGSTRCLSTEMPRLPRQPESGGSVVSEVRTAHLTHRRQQIVKRAVLACGEGSYRILNMAGQPLAEAGDDV